MTRRRSPVPLWLGRRSGRKILFRIAISPEASPAVEARSGWAAIAVTAAKSTAGKAAAETIIRTRKAQRLPEPDHFPG
jgi:hypothetical protein